MKLNEIEEKYFNNTEAIIAKNSILQKIIDLFEVVEQKQKKIVDKYSFNLPVELPVQFGRIFRGENYKGLPYVVLEYPKFYQKENIFTFRTMFWWGNFFSSTLHLSGRFLDHNKSKIFDYLKAHSNDEIFFCVNNTPWEYTYSENNYRIINSLNLNDFYDKDFIKISKKFSYNDYNRIPELSSEFLEFCLINNYE